MKPDFDNLITQARTPGPVSTRAAARLMSVMTDHPASLAELLRGSHDWPQPRLILGITGAPGSGKSTLTDHLATEYRTRFPDRRLGIVAVDPSSPFTGGALLGDRVRMMRHATDPMIFIRSLASRGHLGGLALGAKGVCRVMGLIGCDVVLVETVGVGQSEVEVAQNCDLTMVVLAPGQGDSIQMLKAGLMEAGDLFVVNKADREGANQLFQSLISALQLDALARHDLFNEPIDTPAEVACSGHHALNLGGKPVATAPEQPVSVGIGGTNIFLVSATNHQNISELVDGLEAVTARSQEAWRKERNAQITDELKQALLEEIRHRALEALGRGDVAAQRMQRVLRGDESIEDLATEIMSQALAARGKMPFSRSAIA
jgi:LAO/AO transport system ATPase